MSELKSSPAATAEEAYAKILDHVRDIASQEFQLQYQRDIPRSNSTCLQFKNKLTHLSTKQLKQCILHATKEQVDVELDGDAGHILIVVPGIKRIRWRCGERYSKFQISTVITMMCVWLVVLVSASWLIYDIAQRSGKGVH